MNKQQKRIAVSLVVALLLMGLLGACSGTSQINVCGAGCANQKNVQAAGGDANFNESTNNGNEFTAGGDMSSVPMPTPMPVDPPGQSGGGIPPVAGLVIGLIALLVVGVTLVRSGLPGSIKAARQSNETTPS